MPAELAPFLEVRHLSKHYKIRRLFSSQPYTVQAVDRVTFTIQSGEIFGLVGESGCGKSTVGRLVLRLIEPTAGQVLLKGEVISQKPSSGPGAIRRQMQIVFQDPYSSLNPSFDVRTIIWEGLRQVPGIARQEIDPTIIHLMDRVGLSPDFLRAHPHELSGGQRQRVGIARALSVNPQFLVADEPTSALDVSIQSQILDLFIELQQTMGLTILFISHDFSVIRYLCDRVGVMYLGQVVEMGPAQGVLDAPQHPYTAGLLTSIPRIEQRGTRGRRLLPGELPGPADLPHGCRFHPRCGFARERCQLEEPGLTSNGAGWQVACFYPIQY
jgi:oligopeptide/dipeptide ABC transporter ATP-binding protein